MPGGKIDILLNPDSTGFASKAASDLKGTSGILGTVAKGLGAAVVAGTGLAALGLKKVIDLGTEYQANLNQIQAVSGATGSQMAAVSAKAIALGNDLSLPATSAADAAQAMLELAKGGLSVDQAMQAAKGTLQLAAAAQISGADAATIQANALNSFGLKAAEAGHVADVLANTANQSSGDITDFAQALSQTGAVAHQYGITIDDTSTALGLFANAGIKGSDAGTLLKQALLQLANPSKPATAAIKELGLTAFDAQGKFVGLESLFEQLHTASGKLTQQQYAQATATVFGSDAVRFAGVAAQDTSADWDKMRAAVGKSGGAADVAAAQMKGLGGAVQGFQSTLETAELQLFQVIGPAAEAAVRGATTVLGTVGTKAISGIQEAVKTGRDFGPQIAAAIKSKVGEVEEAGHDLIQPLVSGVEDITLQSVGIISTYVGKVSSAYRTVIGDLEPIAESVDEVVQSVSKAGGPLSAVGTALDVVGSGAKAAAGFVKPLADVVAELVHDFAGLPGPLQDAVIGLAALKIGPGILNSVKTALVGSNAAADDGAKKTGLFGKAFSGLTAPVRAATSLVSGAVGTVRQFSGELQVQSALARSSGQSIGVMGAAVGAFNTSAIPAVKSAADFAAQTRAIQEGAAASGSPINGFSAALGTLVERSPALSAMKSSFDSASEGASRFGGLAGTASAAGTGLKLAAGGLVSALGGPFGLAIAGASLGLGILASRQEDAAKAAAQQKADVSDLAKTLDQSTGAVTQQTRSSVAQANASNGVADAATRQGIALSGLLDAQTGNADAIQSTNVQLHEQAEAFVEGLPGAQGLTQQLSEAGLSLSDFADVATGSQPALKKAQDAISAFSAAGDKKGFVGAGAGLEDFLNKVKGGAGDFAVLGGAIGKSNDDLTAARKQIQDTATAMGTTTGVAADLTDDMTTLSSATSSAADKASALNKALDTLNGSQVDLADAQASVNKNFTDFGDALAQAATDAKSSASGVSAFNSALVDTSGNIVTTTKAGQQFQGFAHDLAGSMSDLAAQTFAVSQQAGDALPESFTKVQEAAVEVRQQFIATAEQMGISAVDAGKLADKYGLIPTQVATLVTTKGTAPQTVKEVQGVIDKVAAVKDKTVTIKSLTSAAATQLQALGYQVAHLPDGQVIITANVAGAYSALNALLHRINTAPATVHVSAVSTHGVQVPQAMGGIVEPYAAGGIRPLRGGYATIVPPNALRVIGDRVRDDESYIPINHSSRSAGILAETAMRMGYALVRQYANGGIAAQDQTPARVGAAGGPTIINNTTVRQNEDAYVVASVVSAQTAWQLKTRRA